MTSTTDTRDRDLWTETVRALGIRTTGKRSPFRNLGTREDAVGMVRDCSIALLLVGLVQVSLSWLAGVGDAADALVYMPLAGLLHRYSSRVAAVLLLAFSLFAVVVIVVGSVLAVEARTDLVLIATLLWASVRAVEATGLLHRSAAEPGESKAESSGRHRGSSAPWLMFAGAAFAIVVAAKFLVPLVQPSDQASSPLASAPAEPDAKNGAPAVVPDDGRMRFSPPNGFVDPRTDEPGIATMAEGFVPSAMELGALFVTPADVEDFRREHRFAPARYVMVQSVRATDDRRVAEEDFRAAKAGGIAASAARIERLLGADRALAQWLESVLRASGTSAELEGTRIQNVGVLEESERSISVGSVVGVGAATQPAAASRVVITSLVLARSKVLVVYTYGAYTKPDDVAATHEVARQVVQNLIHENPA